MGAGNLSSDSHTSRLDSKNFTHLKTSGAPRLLFSGAVLGYGSLRKQGLHGERGSPEEAAFESYNGNLLVVQALCFPVSQDVRSHKFLQPRLPPCPSYHDGLDTPINPGLKPILPPLYLSVSYQVFSHNSEMSRNRSSNRRGFAMVQLKSLF